MRESKRKQKSGYQGGIKATHRIVYEEVKRKSKSGIEYTKYKPKKVSI